MELEHALGDALRSIYTREVCQEHVDQLKERVELSVTAPPVRRELLERGIELNLRAIERCRQIYPDEFEPHQILGGMPPSPDGHLEAQYEDQQNGGLDD